MDPTRPAAPRGRPTHTIPHMSDDPQSNPPNVPQPASPAASKRPDLQIIKWPDPRLRKKSEPVTTFDDALRDVAERMFELMRQHKGVGLAAPQVGVNLRMFVANPTGEPGDDKVYINPVLTDPEGGE